MDALDVAFLEDAVLYYRIPEHNILCVHGGVEPALKALPPTNRLQDMAGRDRKYFGNMMRTRYVNPAGHMVMMGAEKPEDVFWTERYDDRFGQVCYGHQPYVRHTDPHVVGLTVGLDLGCVYGNLLCALVVHPDSRQEVVTVKARAVYAANHMEADSE